MYPIVEYTVVRINTLIQRSWDERGQATPEYALVILAAVALAATLIIWAKQSGAMAQLFSFVMSKVQETAGE